MNQKEITSMIYDTLMGNVGMSEFHVGFPAEEVSDCWCEDHRFYVQFKDGSRFRVDVTPYFWHPMGEAAEELENDWSDGRYDWD